MKRVYAMSEENRKRVEEFVEWSEKALNDLRDLCDNENNLSAHWFIDLLGDYKDVVTGTIDELKENEYNPVYTFRWKENGDNKSVSILKEDLKNQKNWKIAKDKDGEATHADFKYPGLVLRVVFGANGKVELVAANGDETVPFYMIHDEEKPYMEGVSQAEMVTEFGF